MTDHTVSLRIDARSHYHHVELESIAGWGENIAAWELRFRLAHIVPSSVSHPLAPRVPPHLVHSRRLRLFFCRARICGQLRFHHTDPASAWRFFTSSCHVKVRPDSNRSVPPSAEGSHGGNVIHLGIPAAVASFRSVVSIVKDFERFVATSSLSSQHRSIPRLYSGTSRRHRSCALPIVGALDRRYHTGHERRSSLPVKWRSAGSKPNYYQPPRPAVAPHHRGSDSPAQSSNLQTATYVSGSNPAFNSASRPDFRSHHEIGAEYWPPWPRQIGIR